MSQPLVLAITGASGAIYATRLLEVLIQTGHDVHLTISSAGQIVLEQELDIVVDLDRFDAGKLMSDARKVTLGSGLDSDSQTGANRTPGRIHYHHCRDLMAPIASGSFLTMGMVIVPCSGSTLSAIAHAAGGNLIRRAADVHLKEGHKLILVPRETPLSSLQLDNMRRVSEAGAVVLPAAPGWYHGVRSIADLVDFIVGRILDQLGIEHRLMRRWGEERRDV